MGDKWPLQHRHVLGQAIRIRSPYVDALSVTQVLALRSLRKKVDKEELTHGQKECLWSNKRVRRHHQI